MVTAAVDDDVGVDVAGDRGHEPDPVAGVLEDAGLLDVHLDPAGQVVEHARALAPALRLVAGGGGRVPEAPPVVDRAELLAQVILGDALGDDPAAEQHLAKAGALLLQERDQLQRQVVAELGVQAADLERGDDAHRPVVLAPVPVRVAVRADAEHGLARRAVAREQRANGVLRDREAERFELADEVVQRVPVDRRVRVAADRLVAERVVGAGQRLDVALDPLRALLAHRGDSSAVDEAEWPPPAARVKSAVWFTEEHIERREYASAAQALERAFRLGGRRGAPARPATTSPPRGGGTRGRRRRARAAGAAALVALPVASAASAPGPLGS